MIKAISVHLSVNKFDCASGKFIIVLAIWYEPIRFIIIGVAL